jgi:hypothetical protein
MRISQGFTSIPWFMLFVSMLASLGFLRLLFLHNRFIRLGSSVCLSNLVACGVILIRSTGARRRGKPTIEASLLTFCFMLHASCPISNNGVVGRVSKLMIPSIETLITSRRSVGDNINQPENEAATTSKRTAE